MKTLENNEVVIVVPDLDSSLIHISDEDVVERSNAQGFTESSGNSMFVFIIQ